MSTVWCGLTTIKAFAERLKQRRDAALAIKMKVDATLSKRDRTLLQTLYRHRRDWQSLSLRVLKGSSESVAVPQAERFDEVNVRIDEAEKWLSRAKKVLSQMQDGSDGNVQRIRLLKQEVEQCIDTEPQHTRSDSAVTESLETRFDQLKWVVTSLGIMDRTLRTIPLFTSLPESFVITRLGSHTTAIKPEPCATASDPDPRKNRASPAQVAQESKLSRQIKLAERQLDILESTGRQLLTNIKSSVSSAGTEGLQMGDIVVAAVRRTASVMRAVRWSVKVRKVLRKNHSYDVRPPLKHLQLLLQHAPPVLFGDTIWAFDKIPSVSLTQASVERLQSRLRKLHDDAASLHRQLNCIVAACDGGQVSESTAQVTSAVSGDTATDSDSKETSGDKTTDADSTATDIDFEDLNSLKSYVARMESIQNEADKLPVDLDVSTHFDPLKTAIRWQLRALSVIEHAETLEVLKQIVADGKRLAIIRKHTHSRKTLPENSLDRAVNSTFTRLTRRVLQADQWKSIATDIISVPSSSADIRAKYNFDDLDEVAKVAAPQQSSPEGAASVSRDEEMPLGQRVQLPKHLVKQVLDLHGNVLGWRREAEKLTLEILLGFYYPQTADAANILPVSTYCDQLQSIWTEASSLRSTPQVSAPSPVEGTPRASSEEFWDVCEGILDKHFGEIKNSSTRAALSTAVESLQSRLASMSVLTPVSDPGGCFPVQVLEAAFKQDRCDCVELCEKTKVYLNQNLNRVRLRRDLNADIAQLEQLLQSPAFCCFCYRRLGHGIEGPQTFPELCLRMLVWLRSAVALQARIDQSTRLSERLISAVKQPTQVSKSEVKKLLRKRFQVTPNCSSTAAFMERLNQCFAPLMRAHVDPVRAATQLHLPSGSATPESHGALFPDVLHRSNRLSDIVTRVQQWERHAEAALESNAPTDKVQKLLQSGADLRIGGVIQYPFLQAQARCNQASKQTTAHSAPDEAFGLFAPVWAKWGGYPFWPGMVLKPEDSVCADLMRTSGLSTPRRPKAHEPQELVMMFAFEPRRLVWMPRGPQLLQWSSLQVSTQVSAFEHPDLQRATRLGTALKKANDKHPMPAAPTRESRSKNSSLSRHKVAANYDTFFQEIDLELVLRGVSAHARGCWKMMEQKMSAWNESLKPKPLSLAEQVSRRLDLLCKAYHEQKKSASSKRSSVAVADATSPVAKRTKTTSKAKPKEAVKSLKKNKKKATTKIRKVSRKDPPSESNLRPKCTNSLRKRFLQSGEVKRQVGAARVDAIAGDLSHQIESEVYRLFPFARLDLTSALRATHKKG